MSQEIHHNVGDIGAIQGGWVQEGPGDGEGAVYWPWGPQKGHWG